MNRKYITTSLINPCEDLSLLIWIFIRIRMIKIENEYEKHFCCLTFDEWQKQPKYKSDSRIDLSSQTTRPIKTI